MFIFCQKGPQQQNAYKMGNAGGGGGGGGGVNQSGNSGGVNEGGGGRGGGGGGGPSAANFPMNYTLEACERIKEEYQYLQSQIQNLKMELDKLIQEKTEMQRHYVMYYEMSYGLNVEMHKQTEIAKRLSAICAQLVPFLTQEHQQQVSAAIERAKQVTMTDLNAIIGQQMHTQQFPHMAAAAAGAHGLLPPHLASQLGGLAGLAGGLGGGLAGAAAAAGLGNPAAMQAALAGLPGLGGVGVPGGPQIPPPPIGSGLLALGSVAGALVNHQYNQQFNQLKEEKEVIYFQKIYIQKTR
jgi:hypothetical protein